jgi:hypothetical protein
MGLGSLLSPLVSIAFLALGVTACASAGGTAGVFDIGSVWYKHPTTGDVKECGGGFYPGVQIRRYNCGQKYLEQGYVEVENCGQVPQGELCISNAEKRKAEAAERGEEAVGRSVWVLWRPRLDPSGQPLQDQWSPVRGYDSRQECEAEQRRAANHAMLCLPDTVDPRGPKGN